MESHEPSNQVLHYSDDVLLKYIKDLEESGYLEDTMLVFASDHGNHMNLIREL